MGVRPPPGGLGGGGGHPGGWAPPPSVSHGRLKVTGRRRASARGGRGGRASPPQKGPVPPNPASHTHVHTRAPRSCTRPTPVHAHARAHACAHPGPAPPACVHTHTPLLLHTLVHTRPVHAQGPRARLQARVPGGPAHACARVHTRARERTRPGAHARVRATQCPARTRACTHPPRTHPCKRPPRAPQLCTLTLARSRPLHAHVHPGPHASPPATPPSFTGARARAPPLQRAQPPTRVHPSFARTPPPAHTLTCTPVSCSPPARSRAPQVCTLPPPARSPQSCTLTLRRSPGAHSSFCTLTSCTRTCSRAPSHPHAHPAFARRPHARTRVSHPSFGPSPPSPFLHTHTPAAAHTPQAHGPARACTRLHTRVPRPAPLPGGG